MNVRAAALSAFAVLAAASTAAAQDGITALDLARLRELYRLTDTVGELLWPGFDARKLPIAVNHEDRQELLVGHPRPPAPFAPHGDVDGVPMFLREGCTRYGPRGGGWAVDLGGQKTAYVGTQRGAGPTEDWLSLLLHECFHVYQGRFQPDAARGGPWQEPPEDDPAYNARIGLESHVLHAALLAADAAGVQELAATFVAVRHARLQGRSDGLRRCEAASEYNEGTATYVQARLFLLLHEQLSLEPEAGPDPGYHGFPDAEKRYRELVARVLPPPGQPITFFHAQYQNGMAQCLVLDRVRPGWKQELRAPGTSQFQLLERQFPMAAQREAELLAAAERRFCYADLLQAQQRIVAERVALVRGYVERPGRRYRVFHRDLPGRFDWKPQGPVYHVPPAVLPDADRATVWAGGIEAFEKPGLTFRSQKVPVLFRHDYLEWIDPEPTSDDSDLKIEAKANDGEVYTDLVLTTDGFVLRAARARVVRGKDLVAIHPLPAGG
ncbi:MAG: hypothetical protein FJ265_02105 [Planctomycetes bacterium]|nr:hypothetical protein [Planctomycetota bacterium]